MNSRDKRIIGFLFTLLVLVVEGTVYAAVPHDTLRTTAAGVTTQVVDFLNATHYYHGATNITARLYGDYSGLPLTGTTLDTGQGPGELYPGDQYVNTSSSPEFTNVTLTGPFINDWNLTEHFDYPGLPYSYEIGIVPNSSPSVYYAKNGTDGAITSGASFLTLVDSVENLLTTGGEIHLKKGIFDLSDKFVINNDNITLSGEGKNTILNFTYSGTPIQPMIQATSVNGLIIHDLTLNGNKDKLPGASWVNAEGLDLKTVTNSILTNLYIYDVQADGIDLDTCQNILINNVFGKENGQRLVHISSANKYITVSDCFDNKSGIDYDPGAFSGSFDAYYNNQYITFENCKSVDAKRGFAIGSGDNINLVNNMIIGATNVGVILNGTSTNIVLEGNQFIDNLYGIKIVGDGGQVSYSIFHGNTFDDIDRTAFDADGILDYITISNNVFSNGGAGYSCLRLRNSSSQLLTVSGNVFHDIPDAQAGIVTWGSNQTFYGNLFHGVDTGYGFRGFNPATGNFVYGNDFRQIGIVLPRPGDTVYNNLGYVTENSGTGSITNGGTTDVITHGLDYTPTAGDITITFTENPTNSPGAIWVDTIGATQFTVNCENDPGASNLDFSWHVDRH